MAHINGLTCPKNLTGHVYLGVALLPVFWLCGATPYTAATAAGCRALPSSPRDLHGRHPYINSAVKNPEGVYYKTNKGRLISSPKCLHN